MLALLPLLPTKALKSMTIPTQREWVEGCLAYYKENDHQPGNPEDGVWHECHYPVPKCLGGTETILLWKEHHAVQGVLQSEEFQHPCIFLWERDLVKGELLDLCEKWLSAKGVIAGNSSWESLTDAQKEGVRDRFRRNMKATTKEKRERALRWWKSLTPEEREARKWRNYLSPEERAEKNGWTRLTTLDEKRKRNGWDRVDSPQERRERAGWKDGMTLEQKRRKIGWGDEEQRKARARKTHGKPVEVFTLWGVLLTFSSVSEAEEALEIYRGGLAAVLRGRRKHCKGHTARYL